MNATLSQRRYRLGSRMFIRTARSFLWWLAAGTPLTFAISIVFVDELDIGAWAVTGSIFQWFVGVSAGIAIHQVLPTQIATGLTRREIIGAFGVFGALLCAAAVLLVAAGFLAEHALLAAVAEPPVTLGETAAQAARYVVVTPLYCSVGLALGAAEVRLRLGGLNVLALLSAAAVLAVACMWAEYSSAWTPEWIVAGLTLLAVMATAFVLFMRAAPVHPKRV